jgi:1-acyl-sn-glycerol-3-phosphate acyltransferase
MRYVKRILHQDEINEFIRKNGHYKDHDFVAAIIDGFGAKVTWEGLENIPETGGCIVSSNHPLGGLDGIALLYVIAKKRKDLKFIVNDVLLNIANFEGIFVGVNKHGKNTSQTLQLIDTYYAGDIVTVIFPAGLVSRKQEDNLVRDLRWNKSFIGKAKKFEKNIIPTHIGGSNSNFFYNLARWRRRLKIKANIEMFFLINEMYHQYGKNIHIKFGKPIAPSQLTSEKDDAGWAQTVKDYIYKMAESKSDLPFG